MDEARGGGGPTRLMEGGKGVGFDAGGKRSREVLRFVDYFSSPHFLSLHFLRVVSFPTPKHSRAEQRESTGTWRGVKQKKEESIVV